MVEGVPVLLLVCWWQFTTTVESIARREFWHKEAIMGRWLTFLVLLILKRLNLDWKK
jgi:hypothetical protein